MADDIKRLNYFTGQFLDAQDFKDEQTYHVEMRRRANQLLRTPGVISGLQATKTADSKGVTLTPGLALDAQGREVIILPPPAGQPIPVRAVPAGLTGAAIVTIAYAELPTDSHSVVGGYTGATRVTEAPTVQIRTGQVAASEILLAAMQVDANGAITSVDLSVTQKSSLLVAGGLGVGTAAPKATLDVVGVGNISDGTTYAAANAALQKGALAIGSMTASFGGGSGWNANTAGLLLETKANTEIAVHDTPERLSSLLYYQGDAEHRLTIGRDMGWGPIPNVTVAGSLQVGGAVQAENSDLYFTKVNHNHTGFGNTKGFAAIENSENYDALMILGRSQAKIPGDAAAAPKRVVQVWDFLDVNGDLRVTGAAAVNGDLRVAGAVRPSAGKTENRGITFPTDPGGGAGDNAWIRYYSPNDTEKMLLEVGTSNDADDHIALMPSGNVGVGTPDPKDKLHVKGNGPVLALEGTDNAYAEFYSRGVGSGRKGWIGYGDANNDFLTIRNESPNAAGRIHIYGDEVLYLLSKQGVRVSKAWNQGNGTLNVEGQLTAEADASVAGNLTADYVTTNGIEINGTDLRLGGPHLGHNGRALVDDERFIENGQSKSRLTINWGGDWYAVRISGTKFEYPSARALKDNIEALSSEDAQRIVSTLEPVSFSFKSDASKSQCLGFIAEDAPPEVTSGGDSIVPNHIVAALTRVVKDQQRMIEDLERRLARLEGMA
jgi:hypothetical protein